MTQNVVATENATMVMVKINMGEPEDFVSHAQLFSQLIGVDLLSGPVFDRGSGPWVGGRKLQAGGRASRRTAVDV
ncbi:MAG: hypothetical protein AAF995_01625 [Planctomycetota bacterium]